MLRRPPPVSNRERSAKFRKHNPGYHARIKSRQRVSAERDAALYEKRRKEAAAEAQQLANSIQSPIAEPLAIPMPPQRLMLPAPVEPIILPGLKTIETLRVPATSSNR